MELPAGHNDQRRGEEREASQCDKNHLREAGAGVDDLSSPQKSTLSSRTMEEVEMRKGFFAVLLLAVCSFLAAQQAMSNDAVLKLVKAGLSDDLIIATISASPGQYDVSADSIIALKKAGASDKVIGAIVAKSSHATPPVGAAPSAPSSQGGNSGADLSPAAESSVSQAPGQLAMTRPAPSAEKPRIFLQSESKGSQWNAVRDQSMEMSRDFERDCSDVRVTINQNAADYTVLLNHIEHGFVRDNQFQVANRSGDLISKTREGGSIAAGVKKACQVILGDWAKTGGVPPPAR